MGKTDVIVRHVNEDFEFNASKCNWHFDRNCFFMINNFNKERYHCLFSNHSKQWRTYGDAGSCDLSEEMHDMRVLREALGEEYVLPFRYAFRERSGYAIGVFEHRANLYGPNKIDSGNLAEMYFATVVFLCALCRRLGGSPPVLKRASFFYAPNHPVLADVGADNSEKRNRIGNKEAFDKKRWNRFLRNKTCRDVYRYLRGARPELFKKKCGKNQPCVLREEGATRFDDETHALVCKNKSSKIASVLENFSHLAKSETLKNLIAQWVGEFKEFRDDPRERTATRRRNEAER